jgi:hypothetical protein
MKKISYLFFAVLFTPGIGYTQSKIDRKALVERHTIINDKFDSLSSLSVGNGSFAFTMDVTGLQSFPDAYAKGVPLGTQSEWGWHSFIDTANYTFAETLKSYHLNGKDITYSVQIKEPERKKNAVEWFRQNPHRLQLGNIGLEITKKDGSLAGITDIQNIHQTLDMWTGEIHSQFTVENIPVDVITYGHQQQDAIAAKINSTLLNNGRLQVRVRFPYPTGQWTDVGNNFSMDDKHRSTVVSKTNSTALLEHSLDTTSYYAALQWAGKAIVKEKAKHYFVITPSAGNSFEFSCLFSDIKKQLPRLLSPPRLLIVNSSG